MELSEKHVKVVDRSSVDHEFVPVAAGGESWVFSLYLGDDLLEVPGEGEDVTMLLLAELEVSSHSLVEVDDFVGFLLTGGSDIT